MNRVYWVDLGRGTEAEKATTRNLNISFINNNQGPMTAWCLPSIWINSS